MPLSMVARSLGQSQREEKQFGVSVFIENHFSVGPAVISGDDLHPET